MPLNTITVGAAVAPTIVSTYFSHYTNRKPLRQKPTAHISYHQGLCLIRSFLAYASHHTVEEIQAFTSQWVPCPRWVKVDQDTLSPDITGHAAAALINQLGPGGVEKVGGSRWWQWRSDDACLRAEWIEMRSDYRERKHNGGRGRRVMLYVHGGAYFFGSVDEHRYQLQRHARKLRARVFAPKYRLAPQFPFPCGLQDCLAAYLYLLTVQAPEEIILAGDSAGAGMLVSLLVVLRDQGLPLPAAGILVSPWVDLTHSFPSVVGHGELDYIPTHGFMQRPSTSWPPLNEDKIVRVARRQGHGEEFSQREAIEKEAHTKGQSRSNLVAKRAFSSAAAHSDKMAGNSDHDARNCNSSFNAASLLSVEIDGESVTLEDQIHLYTTNQLLSHPLVSPVLQPSLGGLPPLLILTGGGEVLRDEQIYLAHKAACPERYPIVGICQQQYDPALQILNKYPPTNVQLQVWEDLCHVAPTLSFTRPAKYMYRSIAQFGAWALARAQRRSIDITDDDDISLVTDASEDESSPSSSGGGKDKEKSGTGSVGKAGDSLPAFKNHMIRQIVNRHGHTYPMGPASDWAALQMPPGDVGAIKPGPVKKWLAAKTEWDARYASEKRRVQDQRVVDFAEGYCDLVGDGEKPPPSALVGRMRKQDLGSEGRDTVKKSWGMTLWSLWGSKHDKSTIRREADIVNGEVKAEMMTNGATAGEQELVEGDRIKHDRSRTSSSASRARPRRQSRSKSHGSLGAQEASSRRGTRSRTVTVSDQGQTEGILQELRREHQEALAIDGSTSRKGSPSASGGNPLLSSG